MACRSHQEAGRADNGKLVAGLNARLAARFGIDKLVAAQSTPKLYLDRAAIAPKGLAQADVENAAARYLLEQKGIAQVYTRSQVGDDLVVFADHGGAGDVNL